MDLDGLEKIVNANHVAVMRQLASMEEMYREQVKVCCKRMDDVERDIGEHGKVIERSKGVVGVIGAIWAVITAVAALVAPYFWR